MNDPKFTPGPWRTDCRLIGGQIRITQVPNANMTVAQVNGRQGEQEANARLIAAAPEMLEALGELADQTGSLLSELEYQQVSCPLCGEDPGEGEDALCGVVKALGEASSKACAAIAKAKGETE